MHLFGGLFCLFRLNLKYVESDAFSEMLQMYKSFKCCKVANFQCCKCSRSFSLKCCRVFSVAELCGDLEDGSRCC